MVNGFGSALGWQCFNVQIPRSRMSGCNSFVEQANMAVEHVLQASNCARCAALVQPSSLMLIAAAFPSQAFWLCVRLTSPA